MKENRPKTRSMWFLLFSFDVSLAEGLVFQFFYYRVIDGVAPTLAPRDEAHGKEVDKHLRR